MNYYVAIAAILAVIALLQECVIVIQNRRLDYWIGKSSAHLHTYRRLTAAIHENRDPMFWYDPSRDEIAAFLRGRNYADWREFIRDIPGSPGIDWGIL